MLYDILETSVIYMWDDICVVKRLSFDSRKRASLVAGDIAGNREAVHQQFLAIEISFYIIV